MEPRKSARASVRWGLSSLVAAAMLAGVMGGCEMGGTSGGDTNNGGTSGGGAVNDAPDLTFTKPNSSGTVYIGQVLQVAWYATDYDNATVTTLFYDKDGLKGSGDEMQLTQVQKPAKDYSESSFAWDTSQMPPGTYRLLATISDGVNPIVTVYSNYTINLVSSSPTINVVEPYGPKSVMPAENVVINWTQYAPLGQSTVTLFFDTNTSYSDGITNTILTKTEQPNTSSDSYVWNVPAVKAGQYYLGAILNDGTHPPTVAYANGVLGIGGPAIQVYAPSANIQWHSGGSTQIRYQVNSPHGGKVRIFYDRDGVAASGDENWLQYEADVVPTAVTWTWDSVALPLGTYHVGVEVNDNLNEPVVQYASGLVQELGPALTVTKPDIQQDWQGGGTVDVTYTAYAASGTAEIFYDVDGVEGSGDEVIAAGPFPLVNGLSVTRTVTIASLPVGTYNIGVKLADGTTTIWVYATGKIVVTPPPPPPPLTLVEPTASARVSTGAQIVITWINPPSGAATLDLFYDTDKDATNGTSGSIATGIPVNPMTHTWTLPTGIANPPPPYLGYYIGGIVTDSQGAKPATYAAGLITILDRKFFSYPLGSVESLGLGRTLRGYDPNGQLGKVVAHVPWKKVPDPKTAGATLRLQPGISTNGDTTDDFIITAPTANPFSNERIGAGEAYLVLSDPVGLFSQPAVGTLAPLSMSAIGKAALPGTLFAGPAHTGTTDGIGSVALSRAVNQDQRPAVVFGLPYISNIVQEEQDYDPWDQAEYQMEPPPGQTHFYRAYPDNYRQPATANDRQPDGNQTQRQQSGWNNITAGMVVAVSGANAPIGSQTSAPPQQTVIPLDNVGQLSPDPHPGTVWTAQNVQNTLLPAIGLRMYCPWWFNSFTQPQFAGYVWGPISNGNGGMDRSRYGQSVVEADFDGDGFPEWVAVQPCDPSTGAYDAGWLHVSWTYNSQLWTAPLASIPSTTKMTSSWDVWLDTRTATGTSPNITYTTTGPAPLAITAAQVESVRCWSWPYAVSHGRLDLHEEIDQTVQPNTYTFSVVKDDRERWYCWPVVSDYLRGDTTDAPAGHLGGLANVGDFNGDRLEDITVGAPNANLGGAKPNAGCVYLVLGRPSFGDQGLASIGLSVPGALGGIRIVGDNAGDLVGSWQASAGDFNGDGYSDWIIGAPGYKSNRGLAAIIYGTPTLQGRFTLSDIGTRLPGMVFEGEAAGSKAGTCVAGLGDIDGDGFDDVGIVAPSMDWTHADGTVRTQAGVVYVFYGKGKDPVTGDRQSTTAAPTLLADVGTAALPGVIYAGSLDNQPVMTVGPAGDTNADGFADFLIGNPNYDIRIQGVLVSPKVGEVYLIKGGPRPTP